MSSALKRGVLIGVYLLFGSLLSVSGHKVLKERGALEKMMTEGKTYLNRLAGEQTVLSVQKAFSQVMGVLARSLAAGLDVLLQYLTHFLQAAGIKVTLPVNKVTPEGLIFVLQWLLVALLCYWLISLAFKLVSSTLRRALWLLKLAVAFVGFGIILNDHSVGTETMAIRLAVLVGVCVLLGVGTTKGGSEADKITQLRDQVKILERRIYEMERWKRMED